MCSINWGAADWGSVPAWAGVFALLATIWKLFDEAKQRTRNSAAAQLDQARLVTIVVTDFDDTGFTCEVSNLGASYIVEVAPAIQPNHKDAGKNSLPVAVDRHVELMQVSSGRKLCLRLTTKNDFTRRADFTPAIHFTDYKGKRWTKEANGEPKPFKV